MKRDKSETVRKFIRICGVVIIACFIALIVTITRQDKIIRTQKVQINKLRETNSELNLDNKELKASNKALGKMNDQLYDQMFGFEKLPDGKYGVNVDND
jgi:FtsZ-binding cell division protein ZapB